MEFKIRSYEEQSDRAQVENLERRCEVGPAESVFLFTDTMGDPICRIRNSPMYKMLVAELDNKELVGVIQGSIKHVAVPYNKDLAKVGSVPYNKDLAKVGYVLGLRVVPHVRRRGIGSSLVLKLEEWFKSNDVDYAYMATEKENQASVGLFMNKFGYTRFRTPSILVNPVNHRSFRISPNIEISMVKIDQAESLYRRFMGPTTEFFPNDIDKILRNKLSLGTWVAHFKGDHFGNNSDDSQTVPKSWAMLSVWNSGEIFKLRLGKKAPLYCLLYTKSWGLIHKILPCLKMIPSLPDLFSPFGFYFLYGVYHEGPFSGKLVRALCEFVHNMAVVNESCCCKIVVTEVEGRSDELKHHIPHWKLLSTPEDLWCIKALKNKNNDDHDDDGASNNSTWFYDLTRTPPTRALFVDPREV